MSTSKHIDKICIAAIFLTLVLTILSMFGERLGITGAHREEDENIKGMFTVNDLNAEWDTAGACNIVLSGDSAKISGNGAYFRNNTLHIACAGKYVISGTFDGSILIDADGDDKIWLLFDDVDITSETEPPLYIEQADKVFLTLKENSQNTLLFENEDEEATIDGCIFSRDDLTINGEGKLTVTSGKLHGIVCNDSLVFTGGNINISAKDDGVHAHDAIKIYNTTINISAGDDGLHVGNDDEMSIFYLASGNINITECYEGIEANDITIAGGMVNITSSDDGINANGNGKTSLITVLGGDITVINKNGRDADGFDSNGSVNIAGGNVFISIIGTDGNNAIDYGSENGGKCTISGGTVVACGSSQMAECPDSNSSQGFIMTTVSGDENETISVHNADDKEIIRKEIPCSFTSLIISSPDIAIGDTVTLEVGDTKIEIIVDNVGNGGMDGFNNKGRFDPGDRGDQGGSFGWELPNGSEEAFPQKPDEMQRPSKSERGENGNSTFEPPKFDNQQEQYGQFFDDDHNQKSQERMRGNKADNVNDNKELLNKQNAISMSIWIMIGVSTIVLIGGLYIVVKKKY